MKLGQMRRLYQVAMDHAAVCEKIAKAKAMIEAEKAELEAMIKAKAELESKLCEAGVEVGGEERAA